MKLEGNEIILGKDETRISDGSDVIISIPCGDTGSYIRCKTGLDLKTASELAECLNKAVYNVVEKANSVPVVPQVLKALIDLNKVSHLRYSRQCRNDDTKMVLYKIIAKFTDDTTRDYYFECRFFEDDILRKQQLNYVNNIPIIFNNPIDEPKTERATGEIGYNIGGIRLGDYDL
jgi:hypothetical protein